MSACCTTGQPGFLPRWCRSSVSGWPAGTDDGRRSRTPVGGVAVRARSGRRPGGCSPTWPTLVTIRPDHPGLARIHQPVQRRRAPGPRGRRTHLGHPATGRDRRRHDCRGAAERGGTPDTPLWLLCPYDAAALDEHALTEAHRSHPVIVESDIPGQHRIRWSRPCRPPFQCCTARPGLPKRIITFDPHRHRHVDRICGSAGDAGLTIDRTVKLAAAVDEIALAGHRGYGPSGYPALARRNGPDLPGHRPREVDDPMIGRRAATGAPSRGRERAIRLANELCDLVQIITSATGTTVRVHSRS